MSLIFSRSKVSKRKYFKSNQFSGLQKSQLHNVHISKRGFETRIQMAPLLPHPFRALAPLPHMFKGSVQWPNESCHKTRVFTHTPYFPLIKLILKENCLYILFIPGNGIPGIPGNDILSRSRESNVGNPGKKNFYKFKFCCLQIQIFALFRRFEYITLPNAQH